jgi:hypothetical protein
MLQDWCDLSVKKLKSESDNQTRCKEYKANFLVVASRAHSTYKRDLVHLLQLSMDIEGFDLPLDLGT